MKHEKEYHLVEIMWDTDLWASDYYWFISANCEVFYLQNSYTCSVRARYHVMGCNFYLNFN